MRLQSTPQKSHWQKRASERSKMLWYLRLPSPHNEWVATASASRDHAFPIPLLFLSFVKYQHIRAILAALLRNAKESPVADNRKRSTAHRDWRLEIRDWGADILLYTLNEKTRTAGPPRRKKSRRLDVLYCLTHLDFCGRAFCGVVFSLPFSLYT